MSAPVELPGSIPEIADVELITGSRADRGAAIDLLVEVPHGADRLAHFRATRARMRGRLPADLEEFFAVNTDVGAAQIGRRVAERVVAGDPRRRALVVRSLIPRTFIDCNRVEDAREEDLAAGGITASVPAYVHDEADRQTLLALHRRYVAVVETALAALAGDGFLFLPHSYGPRTLGVAEVRDDIVERLRWAHEPERLATWPLRPPVDLITRTADGALHAASSVVEATAAGYGALGIEVADNATYNLHPATLAHRWTMRLPGRSLCLEVRRDLLCTAWTWNRENELDPAAVDRFAGPPADAIDAWLGDRPRAPARR